MAHADNLMIDELADLPLFSIPAYRAAPVRVLFIQDSEAETALFRSTLDTITGETFDLVTATDARTGLYLIASGRFDIAFVAAVMGRESGMDVIRRAGGRICSTPMVLLSDKLDAEQEQKCLLAGAVDVLDRIELSPSLLRRVIRYARFNHETTRRLVVNEQRYRELAENASHANGEKSKFLANMSHELRTPLNAILGFSEAIQHELFGAIEGTGATKYREYVGDINSSGKHLLSLINDLLDLSKIEAGKLEISPSNVRLEEIVEDVARMTAPQARDAKVELETYLPSDSVCIFADGRLIMQAILNIVANAVKFSPPGGHVTLRSHLEGHNIVVSVSDEGCGMTKQDLQHVFEPFHQAGSLETRPEHGTGLGLPLARSIVELHQGGLEIASEIGVGTTVSMWLPRNVRRLNTTAG
jgi:signal transduction histidine kinase